MFKSVNINTNTAATPTPTTTMGMMVSERLFRARERRIGILMRSAVAARRTSKEVFPFLAPPQPRAPALPWHELRAA